MGLTHVQSFDQPAAPSFPIGLVAHWFAGLQRSQSCCHLDYFYLLHLAHDYQHGGGRTTRTQRLYECGQGAQPLRVEDHECDLVPGRVALHAHRREALSGNRVVGHCGGRNADRWCGNWLLGLG